MAVQLNSPEVRPFAEIPLVGLAIKRGDPYLHVGFLYRNDAEEIRLSHLPFHYRFRGSDIPEHSYFWLEPQFNEMVREQVAAFLAHVAEENETGEIPYSIINRETTFDESGKYVPSGVGYGLTCASYILSIFHALNVPLLNFQTWPAGRVGDAQWAESILAKLATADPPASPEHVAVQRAELPNIVRFRPEEVGAAFTIFTSTALTFEQVEPSSLELLALLPPPPPPALASNLVEAD